jgi:hypothetical protein
MTNRGFSKSGDEETRTPDILLAKQALYQLSYAPIYGRTLIRTEESNPLA